MDRHLTSHPTPIVKMMVGRKEEVTVEMSGEKIRFYVHVSCGPNWFGEDRRK